MRLDQGWIALGGLLVLGGCYFDRGDPPTMGAGGAAAWDGDRGGDGLLEGRFEVRDAWMGGDYGPVRGVSVEPYQVLVSGDGGADYIRVDGVHPSTGQWVMTSAIIYGGLDHDAFAPGTTLELDGAYGGYAGEVSVGGVGCSGPRENSASWDEPPSSTQVQVTSGRYPGTRSYQITFRFRDGSESLLRFSIDLPSAATHSELLAAGLRGTLDGVSVNGEVTFVAERGGAEGLTVLLERVEADGSLVRARLDVAGGLGTLREGRHDLLREGGLSFVASTRPAEEELGYPLEAEWLDVENLGVGDRRELRMRAVFASGEVLEALIVYR